MPDDENTDTTQDTATATADPPKPAPETGATQAEVDKAYEKLRAAEKERDDERKKLAERDRKEAEEQGKFKELADTEKARADRLEAEKASEASQRNAERLAGTLKFKDTGYALYLLNSEQVDLSDAAAVRTALEQIATDRTDLIVGSAPPPSGGPAGGTRKDAPALMREALQAMSPQQIAKLDPEVVNAALAAP